MTHHPLTDAGIEKFQADYKAVFETFICCLFYHLSCHRSVCNVNFLCSYFLSSLLIRIFDPCIKGVLLNVE